MNEEQHAAGVLYEAADPTSLSTAELAHLARELQRLMYARSQDGEELWDPAKQSVTSPVDLQPDLELLMRKYRLVSSPAVAVS